MQIIKFKDFLSELSDFLLLRANCKNTNLLMYMFDADFKNIDKIWKDGICVDDFYSFHKAFRQSSICSNSKHDIVIWDLLQDAPAFWDFVHTLNNPNDEHQIVVGWLHREKTTDTPRRWEFCKYLEHIRTDDEIKPIFTQYRRDTK